MGEKGVDTKVVLEGRYGFGHSAYSMGAGREPDKRIKRYLAWYSLWFNGASEERTLRVLDEQRLGEFGSVQTLYARLANDGFPVCKECGKTPEESQHCAKAKKAATKKRRIKVTAAPIQLPPASAASASFAKALDHLRRAADGLYLEEGWLQGPRFVTDMVDRDASERFERKRYTAEDWARLCEQHGADPGREEFWVSTAEAGPGHVGRGPSEALRALVAVYALAYGTAEPLVEELHPDPESADLSEIGVKVEVLAKTADHLAVLLRGGKLGKGNRADDISEVEQFLAWEIRAIDGHEALSDEELCERLMRWSKIIEKDLTPDYVSWIRHLGLIPPDANPRA
jgi:hypothetical protein